MPISYYVKENLNFIYTTFHGRVERSDIIKHLDKIKHDPRIRDGYREICDYRGADTIAVTSDDFFSIVVIEESIETLKSSKLAAVADKTSQFGIGRMYQMIAEKNRPNVKVFTSVSEALQWLGLTEEEIAEDAETS